MMPFLCSWLWRTAGRGGFPHALWLRRIVVPYLILLTTDSLPAALIIAFTTCLPITLKGSKITYWWILALSLLYGLGTSFMFGYPIFKFVSFVATAGLYLIGVTACEYTVDKYADDNWWLFEYCYGFLIGLNVLLSQ